MTQLEQHLLDSAIERLADHINQDPAKKERRYREIIESLHAQVNLPRSVPRKPVKPQRRRNSRSASA